MAIVGWCYVPEIHGKYMKNTTSTSMFWMVWGHVVLPKCKESFIRIYKDGIISSHMHCHLQICRLQFEQTLANSFCSDEAEENATARGGIPQRICPEFRLLTSLFWWINFFCATYGRSSPITVYISTKNRGWEKSTQ